ncbi:MAG: hypothetical protein ACOCX2_13135, partial [Armatimonadota bacterium]
MLRFRAEDFTAKLPWFYHGAEFDPPRETDVVNFEVNGLELPERMYAVTLVLSEPRESLEVSRDGMRFSDALAREGIIPLAPVDVSTGRISLFFRTGAAGASSPVSEVYLHPLDTQPGEASEAEPYDEYVRDIGADDSEALQRWDEYWPMLRDCDLDGRELVEMREALVDWAQRRQVRDEADPHFGAVYSEEDKYDFRDAAAAAVAFARRWRESGDPQWRDR